MKHKEGYFSTDKGQSIYYQFWLPEGNPKASVVIVHGLHEHSGRYQHLAAYLTESGYAVYGIDFPGHGKSAGPRSYVDSYLGLIKPLETFLEMIQEWQAGLPIYLLGHSMGGLFSAAYLTIRPEQIEGAILSGSLVKVPEYVSDLTLQIGRTLAVVLPKFRIVSIDVEGLSRDPSVVQAYRDDPLVFNGKATVRISNEINRTIELVEKEGSAIKHPLLILHGGSDRVCDPSWSQYLYDLVSSSDKRLILYEGLYHEIFNEPEKKQVFADVLNWLERQTA